MLKHLTQGQRDELKQHLVVPMAVTDILRHNLEIAHEMQYGLHMALSEIDPDSALLAIALCANEIANKNLARAPLAHALKAEANNIIDEYGPTWLRHHKKGGTKPSNFEAVLENVPEDLESISDLMEALCTDLDENFTDSPTCILTTLLSIQARAHIEIADFMLNEIEFEKATEDLEDHEIEAKEEVIDMDAYLGKNIIVFPGSAEQQS